MNYTKTVLENGLRIITVPLADHPTVTVLVLAETGSNYELKNENGISHFLEHLCFKGTPARKGLEILRELDGLGAENNAFTGNECTGYYAKARSAHFDRMIEILSDVYLHLSIPVEELEKERGVILGEIDMYEDMPQVKAQQVFMSLVYGDQSAGWPISGSKKVVKSLTRDQIVSYHMRTYTASRTTVIVAGSISESHVLSEIKKHFKGHLKGKNISVPKTDISQTSPRLAIEKKEVAQTHLVMGVRAFPLGHKDAHISDMIATILGQGMSSRLFIKLREEMGVGYYVRAAHESYRSYGHFAIRAGIDTERISEVVRVLLEECIKMLDGVTSEELIKAQEYAIGNLERGLETTDAIAEFYGIQEILRQKIENSEDVIAKIRHITSKDLVRVAKKIFVDQGLSLALVTSSQTEPRMLKKILTFTR